MRVNFDTHLPLEFRQRQLADTRMQAHGVVGCRQGCLSMAKGFADDPLDGRTTDRQWREPLAYHQAQASSLYIVGSARVQHEQRATRYPSPFKGNAKLSGLQQTCRARECRASRAHVENSTAPRHPQTPGARKPPRQGTRLRTELAKQCATLQPCWQRRDVCMRYTARRLRPLARRALMTARPPRVFMRTRKPCVRLRRATEG